jgi:PPOX class probable F420-dependent enzyme
MTEGGNDVSAGTLVGGLSWRRASRLDEAARALLEARNVCVVSTIDARGRIHSIPVWVDTDGINVLLNSVEGRAWVRNLERDPRVTCTIVQDGNPYEFVEIRGRVAARSQAGAEAHIHRLARKYLDLDAYPWLRPEDRRVLITIAPDDVFCMRPGAAELEVGAQ